MLMSRKRISSREASNIAKKRMSTLYKLSVKAADEGNRDRAKRYISMARRISQKTNTPMPKENMYCKRCNMPLSVGKNCRVRLVGGKISITCLECEDINRIPIQKELRE